MEQINLDYVRFDRGSIVLSFYNRYSICVQLVCTNSSKTVNETKINVLSQQHAKDWILCSPMLHNITRPHYQLFGLRPRPKQVS